MMLFASLMIVDYLSKIPTAMSFKSSIFYTSIVSSWKNPIKICLSPKKADLYLNPQEENSKEI